MAIAVIALLAVPAAAAIACLWLPVRAAGLLTAAAGIASFALVLTLVPAASRRDLAWTGFIRVDALSVVFLLATAFLYECVAVYSIGYTGTAGHGGTGDRRYARRFWAGLNPVRLVDAGRPADGQPGAAVGGHRGDHGRVGAAGRAGGRRQRRRGRVEVRPARLGR